MLCLLGLPWGAELIYRIVVAHSCAVMIAGAFQDFSVERTSDSLQEPSSLWCQTGTVAAPSLEGWITIGFLASPV